MSWTERDKRLVWNNATIVTHEEKDIWRKEACGAWISWNQFGNRDSEYGWEIDHITAVANGGGNELNNLQALYWKNNEFKADKTTTRYCVVTAKGTRNQGV
ncbi:hypothetical protein CI105_08865 [Candidatus Izimaplasma bacterium ZiA1]|uniref:HNH endonuclease signature motif containing protein n=1 Tax=Candidatus Izimoplasma sp. ZiA1 TaxID=2024899 RepID=UPI000BAA6518|nr:hypothetical protein CI105_08865 [Candidatus Izimaplasma bacterium ZiA1]